MKKLSLGTLKRTVGCHPPVFKVKPDKGVGYVGGGWVSAPLHQIDEVLRLTLRVDHRQARAHLFADGERVGEIPQVTSVDVTQTWQIFLVVFFR